MQSLLAALTPLLERLKALDIKQRLGLAIGVALLVSLGVWGWATATAPKYEVLFANLDASDAGEIVERLREARVPYKLENGGSEIMVPEANVHELRLTLAGEGLPSGGGIGFELFDQQRFGESEFSEQVKYHRALEGELSRTITHLSGVEHARVHLVLPKQSLFESSNNSASASVVLRMRPGGRLSKDQTRGIVHLVASSVRGLAPEGVTIVDGSGRRLSGGDDEAEVASNGLDLQQRHEKEIERAIQQILDMAVGPRHGMVHVAVDMNFTREELTEERVDPEAVAARSFQIVEERDVNAAGKAGGVPGAVSTLEGSDPNLTDSGSSGNTRRSETRNFEISKTVRKAIEPVGRVRRLSIAVAVDGTWSGEGEKRKFSPRTEQELATIKSLVATAAGADLTRGDQVTVECVPFQEPELLPERVPTAIEALVENHLPWIAGGGALLLVLIIAAVVLLKRRANKKKKEEEEEEAKRRKQLALTLDRAVPESLTVTAEDAAESKDDAQEVEPVTAPQLAEDAQEEAEQTRALTAEIASNDPYLAARVIRAWLGESTTTDDSSESNESSDSEAAA